MLKGHAFVVDGLLILSSVLACFLQNLRPAFVLSQLSLLFALVHALIDLRKLEGARGLARPLFVPLLQTALRRHADGLVADVTSNKRPVLFSIDRGDKRISVSLDN